MEYDIHFSNRQIDMFFINYLCNDDMLSLWCQTRLKNLNNAIQGNFGSESSNMIFIFHIDKFLDIIATFISKMVENCNKYKFDFENKKGSLSCVSEQNKLSTISVNSYIQVIKMYSLSANKGERKFVRADIDQPMEAY